MLVRAFLSPIVTGVLLLFASITWIVADVVSAMSLTVGLAAIIALALGQNEKRVALLVLEQTSFRLISVEIGGGTWYRVERHVQFPYGWHNWRLEGDVYDTDEAASAFYDRCVEDLKETLQDLRSRYTMGTNAKLLTSVRAADLRKIKTMARASTAVVVGSSSWAGTPAMPPPPPPRRPKPRRVKG